MFAHGRYRSCWYDVGDRRGSIAAVGIHGQWLWIDPQARIVIARTASRPDPSDDDATALEIHMLGQIARACGESGPLP
jgi:CubicO group peptidase (beta-lactamase class C family)